MKAAELEALARRQLDELKAAGEEVHPVIGKTRKLAAHFWGAAWMKHLALCESGGWSLAPGRTLLRHGCVLDLQLAGGCIRARVMEERLHEVEIAIDALDDERIDALRMACSGRIASLVPLLEGTLDDALLATLCDPETGLLPDPAAWHMSCTCPEWSEPCPHAAAAIYAAGILIDADPALLFFLRQLAPEELLQSPAPKAAEAEFDLAALASTFHIEMEPAPANRGEQPGSSGPSPQGE